MRRAAFRRAALRLMPLDLADRIRRMMHPWTVVAEPEAGLDQDDPIRPAWGPAPRSDAGRGATKAARRGRGSALVVPPRVFRRNSWRCGPPCPRPERKIEAGQAQGSRRPGRPGGSDRVAGPVRSGPETLSGGWPALRGMAQSTRPGFRMSSGSSAALMARMKRMASGPRWTSSQSRRASPMPCSAVTVPPSSSAAR